jgi:N-acetylmuramoyl-L-alanine amidase
MASCIHPIPGDFHTTASNTTLTPPEITISTTPQQTPPEITSPEETTSGQTTPEETRPPEVTTTPEETTPPKEPTNTTPEETTTEQPTETPPVEKIKIYIDQGHNPFSPTHPPSWNTGASNLNLGLYEQDITYDFGIRLAELLEQDGRFEVRLSRPTADTILGTDNDSALDFRVNDAAEWGADYFISLHTNAADISSARGLEVYTTTDDSDGYELGEQILNALVKSTELRNRGMKNGDHLRVLKNAKMPAALIEMGFISNEDDAILLRDSSDLFITGLYNGIISYFDGLEEATVTE